jgi:hypothetical protein
VICPRRVGRLTVTDAMLEHIRDVLGEAGDTDAVTTLAGAVLRYYRPLMLSGRATPATTATPTNAPAVDHGMTRCPTGPRMDEKIQCGCRARPWFPFLYLPPNARAHVAPRVSSIPF